VFPRPRFRLPLWAALAITAAAYLVRSLMRGYDFRPDMPADAFALAALAVVVALVGWIRSQPESHEPEERPGQDPDDGDSTAR